jgi:DnaJ-class molecular chaperone
MDYYKILNVSEDASLKEIEQAYKDLASFYNPENNVSRNAYKKFREVNEAYKVLSQIKQREMYDRLHLKEEVKEEVSKGELLKLDNYLSVTSNSVSNYEVINDYKEEIYVKVRLSYLYYLTNSDYKVDYIRNVLVYNDNVCPVCNGNKQVKKDNRIVNCPHCLKKGKDNTKKEVKESVIINCNNETLMIDREDYKLYIEFDFFDKEFYKVNNNEIFVDYVVSYDDYKNGIEFDLRKDDYHLNITSVSFSNDTYTFLDKIIHFNFILSKYKGEDLEAYIVSDKKVIYLNLNDYSYMNEPSDNCTYKVNLDSDYLTLEGLGKKGYNDKNGNLNIKVIRIKNDSYNSLFFDRKIKRVSSLLFKLKGDYNNHFFKNSNFEYDDNYIYLPSKAYKLKSKNYFALKIIYASLYLIVPLIMFLIMGFSSAFVISVLLFFVGYLLVSNLLMEVKL